MSEQQPAEEWACGYCIEFSDGGPCEGQLLHTGTQTSCEEAADLIPAVAYNGTRPVTRAHIVICPLASWQDGTT